MVTAQRSAAARDQKHDYPRQPMLPIRLEQEQCRWDPCEPPVTALDDYQAVRIAAQLTSREFQAFLAVPEGEFPIAVLPPRIRRMFPHHWLLVLTEQIARKMADKHVDVAAADYRSIARRIASSSRLHRAAESPADRCVLFWLAKDGKRWRLVIEFDGQSDKAHIVTFHRITRRAYRARAGSLNIDPSH
jgi:hypothetical protein